MQKPHHIKKGKYWRYITTDTGGKKVGLFSWPENKLLARYGLHTGPGKRRSHINPEITSNVYPQRKRKKTKRPPVNSSSSAYPERDESLRKLGIKSYPAYLRCKTWKAIKECLLDNRQCLICGFPANVLHHRDYSYATMRGDNPGSLVPLCRACHYLIEFDDNNNKIFSLVEVNARLESFQNKA